MKTLIACCLITGLCWSAGSLWADEPTEPNDASALAARLEALDETDAELAEAKQQLELATSRPARRELTQRIRKLEATQERILQELEEELFGPRLPEVRDTPLSSLEEQLEVRQRHHEAILESNVERRLPTD